MVWGTVFLCGAAFFLGMAFVLSPLFGPSMQQLARTRARGDVSAVLVELTIVAILIGVAALFFAKDGAL